MYTKIIAVVFLGLTIIALIVLSFCAQIAATRHGYIDLNSGRLKSQYVSFGRVYQQSVEETEYSRLLKTYGFEELPANWQPTYSRELGLRYMLKTQRVHQKYVKLPTDTDGFAWWLKLKEGMSEQEKRKRLEEFHAFIRVGTPKQIHEYVQDLIYGNLKKDEK